MYRKTLGVVIVLALIPVAFAYDPIGDYVWFSISPASNNDLGGVISMECPVGELPYAIFDNGTLACAVP